MIKKKIRTNTRILLNIFLALLLAIIISFSGCSYFSNSSISETNSKASEEMLSVHFLDVAQGDSIFIELPNTQTMLIDSGINGLAYNIESYIKSLGHTKIDYIVATHPHADHIGSMDEIIKDMSVGKIYMPKALSTTKTYENLLNAISDKGLKISTAKSGVNIINEKDLQVNIIGPEKIDSENLNNSSAIVKITYKKENFLFVGDAKKEELASIKSDMSADVLKVGHHGSRTSTTKDFLERVNPKIAVISCAKHNDYGHPHKETINLLNKFKVKVYKTYNDSTINVTTDGTKLNVETGLKPMTEEY